MPEPEDGLIVQESTITLEIQQRDRESAPYQARFRPGCWYVGGTVEEAISQAVQLADEEAIHESVGVLWDRELDTDNNQ